MPNAAVTAYWVSCPRFTVRVETITTPDGNNILVTASPGTAPVVRRFIGQPLTNLITWFSRFGEVDYEEL